MAQGIDRWSRGLALALAVSLASCGSGGGSEPAPAPSPAPSAQPSLRVSFEDLEALGPFASWSNAQGYGAVGDGVADDSAALQRALDDLAKPGQPFVLRLPAGSYRITRSLAVTGTATTYGLAIVGDDPATTRIVWDGPTGDPMLVVNGGVQSSFARITWDGRARAGYGVAHWWNRSVAPVYGGSVEHADEVFVDMEIGIQGGRLGTDYGALDSEGQIRRVNFVRNTKAGLNVGSFNALNWWVWDSRFVDCARGVSNLFTVADTPGADGAGNFIVYRSVFERSTVADANVGNTGWFGLYQNVSSGSRRFFQGEPAGANGARVILQGNRVLDTTDPVAVDNGNLGPLMLIDNQFRSATSAGPVVSVDTTAAGADVVSIGNRYTVGDAVRKRFTADRLLSLQDQTVDRSAIASALPAAPGTPVRAARQVFDVAAGSSAVTIQAAIDAAVAAAAAGAVNPVVHLPAGTYPIDRTLVVPAGVRLQIAGDSIGTVLRWNGSGPMLRLAGPSRATVRDLRLEGTGQTAIAIEQADQDEGRILVVGSAMGPTAVTQLLRTRLSMQANTGFAALTLTQVASALSLGVGGLGPLQMSQGSNLMLSDSWFEGPQTALFRMDGGRFTYRGGHIAPGDPRFGPAPVEPAILLENYAGTAAFVGLELTLPAAGNGIRIGAETASTNALFMGLEATRDGYFSRSASGGSVGLLSSRQRTAASNQDSTPVADAGQAGSAFVLDTLAQARSLVWDTAPAASPAGATDVRLYRLMTVDTAQGLRISGAP